MSVNLINIIFGMKLRQARLEAGLSLSQFAAQCELSPSYMTEIEKGRKYPRSDKIVRMAEALGKAYDELVSVSLDPSLSHLDSALNSSVLLEFPFEEFGLESGDLFNLLTRVPDRSSALLHALLGLGRQFDLAEEDFLKAALRSYQELHDNYFPDVEDAVLECQAKFGAAYGLGSTLPLDGAALESILRREFGYFIDDSVLHDDPDLQSCRMAYLAAERPRLLVNRRLLDNQITFLLAKELGYQFLGLKERSSTSMPLRIDSFEQILNDFKAAYFGGALLMPRSEMLEDLKQFFASPVWDPGFLYAMLDRYAVTPEMLLYRWSELMPEFFGFKLHFLRFRQTGREFRLANQFNMNRLLVPSGIGLNEHACRRWLPIRLLNRLGEDSSVSDSPCIGAQVSESLESQVRFLTIGFARPLVLAPELKSCVSIGFEVDSALNRTIAWREDPALAQVLVNETCERCPLPAEQCKERAAEPVVLKANEAVRNRRMALDRLAESYRLPSRRA